MNNNLLYTKGNEDLVNTTITILEGFLENCSNNEKNILLLLINILKNPETRVDYVTIKSIIIIYSFIKVFENLFKKLGKEEIDELITNLNLHFLQEDLNIHFDLEQKIIDIIVSNSNIQADELLIISFKSEIRPILNTIIANKETKDKLKASDIKEILLKILNEKIEKLRNSLQNDPVFQTILNTKTEFEKSI